MELPGALAESLQKRGGLPDIYYRKGLRSPCLAGIVHPAVFLNEKAMRDEETLKMVLLHEQMHYRQKDHIWNLCRNLMCIVYWFHPLVWRGAAMSMQDAELACDERVVKGMGKKERRSYGTVLLDLLDGNGRGAKALDAATAMAGGKKEIEERIYGIARRRRTRNGVLAAGLILLLGAGVVGCTRVGADGGSSGGILPQQETQGADRAQGADGGDGGYSAFAETEASEELAGEGKNASGQQDGEEETEVPKREALFSSATPIGSVQLVYKDEEIMIFTGYFGLAVFRYGEGAGECGVTDTLDLSAIGCDRIGGDSAGMIRASRDGTQIYMRAGNGRDVYHYDRAQGKLYRVGLSAWPSEEALYAAEEEEAYGWDANKSAEIGNLFVSRRRAGSEEKLPFWNEGTKAYMKALKARYDRGERELIVDEGWNGAYPAEPEPVRDLGGVEGQWRKVISCVDENGDKIENPYEYPAWFERMDGSKKLSVRSFDELICSWGDLLFYRYDKTIWVTRSDAVNPFFSLPEGDGSIELYTAGKELGAYRHGRENSGTLTFYDSRFNVVKQYSNVRLEEFSESYYCLMDLDTGLYGYADDSGELVIPFSYSLAKGFHNGYAAVLTGAEAEIYYEDHTDKMFNQIGGFWGIINKKGNYVIEPDEKYSNSFERGDLEGTTARYINGPVGFLEVREDKTADFVRWEDQKVLYTVTIPEETPEF